MWNKSNREHNIIGSDPSQTRQAADQAVKDLAWQQPYFLDADHISLTTVERFIAPCDFFTIDVAEKIGSPASPGDIQEFVRRRTELSAEIVLSPGSILKATREQVENIAQKYLAAVQEAGRIYHFIEERKGAGNFIPEISMDETDLPQQPIELLVILAAIADEKIPIQTIAPKFSGRFNKGVDYRGDVEAFTREFTADLAVLDYAVRNYDLPANLKLSVHSGSDKFSLYKPIHRAITDAGSGLHLKTAGTTWLAELTGLAMAGGDALKLAQEIYAHAYKQIDELCAPYASVIEIDHTQLPSSEIVSTWTSEEFVGALQHDPKSRLYNPSLRQLLHVGFKVAAKMGERFTAAVKRHKEVIAREVTANLFERHIRPAFLDS